MVRNASVILAAIGLSCIVPFDRPAARAEHMVVVPTTEGKDCIDLDSRWGVGVILAWRQTICGSDQEPVWVQTDCSQDFASKGYWLATSPDGKDFSRKTRYDADQFASSIARFVCLSVAR
jgi:hypothetical protein